MKYLCLLGIFLFITGCSVSRYHDSALFIDNVYIGVIGQEEFNRVKLKSGKHILKVMTGLRVVKTVLTVGETTKIKIRLDGDEISISYDN